MFQAQAASETRIKIADHLLDLTQAAHADCEDSYSANARTRIRGTAAGDRRDEHPDKTGAWRDGTTASEACEGRRCPHDCAARPRQDRRHAADGCDRGAALGARIL